LFSPIRSKEPKRIGDSHANLGGSLIRFLELSGFWSKCRFDFLLRSWRDVDKYIHLLANKKLVVAVAVDRIDHLQDPGVDPLSVVAS